MQESFQISQELTLQEYLKMSFYILSRMKVVQRMFLLSIIISVINGVLNLPFITKQEANPVATIMNFLYGPLFLTLFFGILLSLFNIIIYKFKPLLFKGTVYRFTAWGMEKFNQKTNTTAPWREFTGYKETKRFIYLFLKNDCHVVQKRLFKTTAQLDSFRVVIQSNINT